MFQIKKVSELNSLLLAKFISEMISVTKVKEEVADAKKTQKIDNGIEAQSKILELSGQQWAFILEEASSKGLFTPKEMGTLSSATKIPNYLAK